MKKNIIAFVLIMVLAFSVTPVQAKDKYQELTLYCSTEYPHSDYGTAYRNSYIDANGYFYMEWVARSGKQIIPLEKVMLDDGTQSKLNIDVIQGELK